MFNWRPVDLRYGHCRDLAPTMKILGGQQSSERGTRPRHSNARCCNLEKSSRGGACEEVCMWPGCTALESLKRLTNAPPHSPWGWGGGLTQGSPPPPVLGLKAGQMKKLSLLLTAPSDNTFLTTRKKYTCPALEVSDMTLLPIVSPALALATSVRPI